MTLEQPCRPEPLVDAITGFLAHVHVSDVVGIRTRIEQVIDDAASGALESLRHHLENTGQAWAYFPKDELAQRLHHVIADCLLREPPVLIGAENLDMIAGAPTIIFSNHLSYVDANALEVTFQLTGHRELADRLVAIAGPKVYSDLKRRFSSLCFGTIKVPQHSARASGEAVMALRQIAMAAQQAIDAAQRCLDERQALLIFPEGTRSRTASLQPFLPGVARYLQGANPWVVPIGLWGTERLFPMGEAAFNPVPVTVSVGHPVRAHELAERWKGDRRAIMEHVGRSVSALLPRAYRGAYAP
jgi:1-acyl-sn-glycerol-3-phosphate acyltransferase